ncbi:cytochrome c oxidase subunit II [Occallatibacter savannae]|uniref:cytochrome c oxidase subunit II n=1 Tax=Occallatibacter savannae TaxID=1002691 RepID=UPI001EF622D2|nr:cytochrome c oxidase subunit II [Occallatibacter savannae]
MKSRANLVRRWLFAAGVLLLSECAWSAPSSTSIFSNKTTPAHQLNDLSMFVLGITGLIYVGVSSLLLYAIVKFRARKGDTTEPPQVFGSIQIELSWTIIPILIIVVLFLTTARVLFSVQDAPKPKNALDVIVVGHQFWWEFRYPQYNVVTANELHLPVSSKDAPRPAFMKLTSADVMHSFWVPQLDGKTDVLPNRVNEMWIDPHETGLYLGQCAQFCGPEHAKMLLRVYVDTPEQFKAWIAAQQRTQAELTAVPGGPEGSANEAAPNVGNEAGVVQAAATSKAPPNSPTTRGNVTPSMGEQQQISARMGQYVFEHEACISCHTVAGTVATGRYGPDLTHMMSRETIASGAVPLTKENLLAWINDPNQLKPGSLMPAMHLSERQNEQITAYLMTLK